MMTRVNPLVPHILPEAGLTPSAWRRMSRGAIHRAAGRAARRHAGPVFTCAALAGAGAHALRLYGPAPAMVGALFPDAGSKTHRIARAIAALQFMNQTAIGIARDDGPPALSPLVRNVADVQERFRDAGPALVLTWHIGAIFGVSAALHAIGADPLILREPVGREARRAQVLKQAMDRLRAGGIVVAVADAPGGGSTDTLSCLGRRVAFRRGVFMLARAADVPLYPAVARWDAPGVLRVRIDSELDRGGSRNGAVEHALATSAAAWLEQYLRREPEQIWDYTLRNFLDAPFA